MDNDKLILGRIKDLAKRAFEGNYVTHTDFLSASEAYEVNALCAGEGLITGDHQIDGVDYCVYGGSEDPDRVLMCFLPSYMSAQDFLAAERENGDIVSCILIEPANRKFADELSHRDFLGSLMNLGIERNRIGDIRSDATKGYVFVLKEVAGLICEELCRIKHTTVTCREVPVGDCDIVPEFADITGTVSSLRLDAILSLVYKPSRGKTAELIKSERVFVDGKTILSPGHELRIGNRVSVRGFGKFEFEGSSGVSKKGRLMVSIKKYK
ncbi:MAG: hypothetical protein IK054_00835 [Lachnospiraceae bacterium]|nr:hypothetical protein [Lachnospiraceae bacterium]